MQHVYCFLLNLRLSGNTDFAVNLRVFFKYRIVIRFLIHVLGLGIYLWSWNTTHWIYSLRWLNCFRGRFKHEDILFLLPTKPKKAIHVAIHVQPILCLKCLRSHLSYSWKFSCIKSILESLRYVYPLKILQYIFVLNN